MWSCKINLVNKTNVKLTKKGHTKIKGLTVLFFAYHCFPCDLKLIHDVN